MFKEVHEHIVSELQQSARGDTGFVVSAVLFNLVVMGINWGVASERADLGDRRPLDREETGLILSRMDSETGLI